MCGRYSIIELRLLKTALGVPGDQEFDQFIQAHADGLYNVAPSRLCPVVRLNQTDDPTLGLARWGLIPSWTRDKPRLQPINARSETAATSGMFRQALQRRRCLVPADGFYEWQGARPPRQPFYVRLKGGGTFAFAGLWEQYKPNAQSDALQTFTILTTTPNALMQPIHNRMPVILARRDYARWLDRRNKAADVADLLKPFDADRMEAWKVSTRLNTPGSDGPDLIKPLP